MASKEPACIPAQRAHPAHGCLGEQASKALPTSRHFA